MKLVRITYGVGYGRHSEVVEIDAVSDEDLEEIVKHMVMERLDWSYTIEYEEPEEKA